MRRSANRFTGSEWVGPMGDASRRSFLFCLCCFPYALQFFSNCFDCLLFVTSGCHPSMTLLLVTPGCHFNKRVARGRYFMINVAGICEHVDDAVVSALGFGAREPGARTRMRRGAMSRFFALPAAMVLTTIALVTVPLASPRSRREGRSQRPSLHR